MVLGNGSGGLLLFRSDEASDGGNNGENHPLTVFPNPVLGQDYFRIQSGETAIIRISDAAGRIILDNITILASSSYQFSTNKFGSGAYFITAVFPDGTRVVRKLIIVKK
jgi:hypothetical protein